uniref:Uncharacterized protein n=1 Tax=viral metagenome TaxID=1070528 RepID=A0A6C0LEA1_9ZZZZ
MCKCNKPDSIISKRTSRYFKRTIKKNNKEIFNDKIYIKLLNESLKYMTDYAISSYNYNNYLVYMITNLVHNHSNEVSSIPDTEKSNSTEQTTKVPVKKNLCKEDICAYV